MRLRPATPGTKEDLDPLRGYLLEASRNRVPRFLFRAFNHYSSGLPGLNSEYSIVPLGFHLRPHHRSIYDMPLTELRSMIHAHLTGASHLPSDFSSWTHSLLVAIEVAHFRAASHKDSTTIAILDTHKLPPHVAAYYLPELTAAGLVTGITDPTFADFEFLLHGPVHRPAYVCASFAAVAPTLFRRSLLPELASTSQAWGARQRQALFSDARPRPLRVEEVVAATRAAEAFVRDEYTECGFVFGVLAAVLGLRERAWTGSDRALREDAMLVLRWLRMMPGIAVLLDGWEWEGGRRGYCTAGFPEVEQSCLLLAEMGRR